MTGYVIVLALAALLCFVLAIAHYAFWTRRFAIAMDYAEHHRIETPDGSAIELYRLPPLGIDITTHRHATPVLCVHGVGIDHRNNDMVPQVSLARHLREAGHDVWLLRLRSGGTSRRFGHGRKVRFRTMAAQDVPLGIAGVLERTGAPQLDYVGFSMGGMLLYAGLATRAIDPAMLRKVVILGSPARVGQHVPFKGLLTRIPAPLVPPLPLRLGSRMAAFAAEWFGTPIHDLVYNAGNVDRGIAGRAMMTIEDIPGPLNVDFLSFIRRGIVHIDGKDVAEGLRDVRVPVLFFAGARDRLAPPESVRVAFDNWGALYEGEVIDKTFVLLAKDAGSADDYGHGDLAIGRSAKKDIFEPVERFLAS